MIPSKGLDQNSDNSFVDKYWGRVPKMLHSIPETDTWVCNPEYLQLMQDYVTGSIVEENVSIELYAEIEAIINAMDGSVPVSPEDAALIECFGVISVPGNITNFKASDTLRGEIVMTWIPESQGIPLPLYKLFEDGIRVASGISVGHSLDRDDETHDYYVEAENTSGSITSNTDSGTSLPTAQMSDPIILTASDDRTGSVAITWTTTFVGLPEPEYSLYENNIFVESGIENGYVHYVSPGVRDYYVIAANSSGIVQSSTDSGQSLYNEGAPGEIIYFNASDDLIEEVECTWVHENVGSPICTYDLYEDNIMVAAGVTTPYTHSVLAGTKLYFVMARNIFGAVVSPKDEGTAFILAAAPDPLTSVNATDVEFGQTTVTWDLDTAGNLPPKYRLFEDGIMVADDITTPYIHTGAAGTYTYIVEAYNATGISSGTDSGTIIDPPYSEVILPQFTETTSVTLYIESLALSGTKDMNITNTLDQPSLRFDGVLPTSGVINFQNAGTITGTESGEDALLFLYKLKLTNTGIISGAGGKGGQGGTGGIGSTQTVSSTANKAINSGDSIYACEGWSSSPSSSHCAVNGPYTYSFDVTAQNGATGTVSYTQANDESAFVGSSVSIGGRSVRLEGGVGYKCLEASPGGSLLVVFSSGFTCTSTAACTVPGGPGGMGGAGGNGVNFNSATVTDGTAGGVGSTITACDGTTSTVGYSGGQGGRGGMPGVNGIVGFDGVNNAGSGVPGGEYGSAIVGSSLLDSASIAGNVVGGIKQ